MSAGEAIERGAATTAGRIDAHVAERHGALDVIEVRGDRGAVPTGFDAVMRESLTPRITTMLALPIGGRFMVTGDPTTIARLHLRVSRPDGRLARCSRELLLPGAPQTAGIPFCCPVGSDRALLE